MRSNLEKLAEELKKKLEELVKNRLPKSFARIKIKYFKGEDKFIFLMLSYKILAQFLDNKDILEPILEYKNDENLFHKVKLALKELLESDLLISFFLAALKKDISEEIIKAIQAKILFEN